MKTTILTVILALATTVLAAQDNGLLKLQLEARVDYMQEYQAGSKINGNSGFSGRYLNLLIDGNIGEGFSYSFRQRLNKPISVSTLFDATDWITLTYSKENWGISAGKQVVGIGGFEYDGAPIDLYFCSEFWNNIPCYQFGASVSYTTDNGNDRFMLQFCESPFRRNIRNTRNKEMFAYNAMWTSSHGVFSSLYSVNMIEYLPGKFINYIVLGNRFTFGDLTLTVDLMNRALSVKDFFGKDMSVMGELSWEPVDRLRIFARMTYDVNRSETEGDWCVRPGTDILRVGGGLEYYPIRKYRNIRLHLNGCWTDGASAAEGVLRPRQTIVDGGVTWKINMLNIKKKQ